MEMKRRQDEREEEDGVSVVLHEFYSKDFASKCVINARSALPWNSKRTILTQEVLRILLNCSRELQALYCREVPWATVISHVNNMMLRLQYSGYDQKFRAEVVRSALKAYNRLVELDASGEQPLYGPMTPYEHALVIKHSLADFRTSRRLLSIKVAEYSFLVYRC